MKKFLAILFAALMCLALVACGESGTNGENGDGQSSEQTGDNNDGDEKGDGLAGKTFVVYDVECEGMDAALLQEYKQRNLSQKCTFNDDGTAVMTASAGGANLAYTLTYTVNGKDVTLTVTSLTVNGEASPLPDPAPTMQCTYDGTNFVMLSPLQDGSTLHLIMREKTA